MANRFPLYTDEDVHGDVVELLLKRGWDLVRAVDRFPQGTDDSIHFERAAEERRVLVTNDQPSIEEAKRGLLEGKSFTGVVTWPRKHYARMSIGEIVDKIEALTYEEDPFVYPIRYIRPD